MTTLHQSHAAIRYAMQTTSRNSFDELQSYPDIEATFIAFLSPENSSEGNLRLAPCLSRLINIILTFIMLTMYLIADQLTAYRTLAKKKREVPRFRRLSSEVQFTCTIRVPT